VKPNSSPNRLAPAAAAVAAAGLVIFIIGLFPGLVQRKVTPGLGLLQISVFLAGLTPTTLGACLYL
jgi:hypothetical protein